jgi:hypothetical protein
MKLSHAIGGLAGACALTLINQGVARLDREAPRLDLLGMNAVAKLVKTVQPMAPLAVSLFPAAVAGDLVANSMYYSLAGGPSKASTLLKGMLLGLGAGIGAVGLPSTLGLNEMPTNLTPRRRLMTIAYYIAGGLIAAATINAMDKTRKKVV